MAISGIKHDPIKDSIDYQTPTVVCLQRLALKVIELWRSFFSTLNNLCTSSDNKIQKGALLSNIDVIHNTQNIENLGLINNVASLTKKELDDNAKKQVLFFPHIIKGTFRNHIVFFAVNKQKEEIIFYDSKGYTVADYGLKNIYKKLKAYFPNYNFVQNIKKEQYDSFNCGIYAIKKIRQIAKRPNMGFKEILLSSQYNISYQDAMQARKTSEIESYNPIKTEDDLEILDDDILDDELTQSLDDSLGILKLSSYDSTYSIDDVI